MPLWLLVQRGTSKPMTLDHRVAKLFQGARDEICTEGDVALLIDSPGGYADVAYRIARVFQRCEGSFTVIIPRYAKSAATLLALGADEVIMGRDAEIGPLDAQLWDGEREEHSSALDEVQALEQLHKVALEQLDQTMMMMVTNIRKRTDVLLPHATKFVNDMMRPLLDKVDTVHYAKQARILKIAEEYARRLMANRPRHEANRVADKLVNGYPEHAFVIDRDETERERFLPVIEPSDEVTEALERVERYLWKNNTLAFGRVEES